MPALPAPSPEIPRVSKFSSVQTQTSVRKRSALATFPTPPDCLQLFPLLSFLREKLILLGENLKEEVAGLDCQKLGPRLAVILPSSHLPRIPALCLSVQLALGS